MGVEELTATWRGWYIQLNFFPKRELKVINGNQASRRDVHTNEIEGRGKEKKMVAFKMYKEFCLA